MPTTTDKPKLDLDALVLGRIHAEQLAHHLYLLSWTADGDTFRRYHLGQVAGVLASLESAMAKLRPALEAATAPVAEAA